MRKMFCPEEFLDLTQFPFPELFADVRQVWDALKKLPEFMAGHLQPGSHATLTGTPYIAGNVQIGRGTTVEHGAVILGPAIIGENCRIRSSAYIRSNVIIGNDCVLGNACEFKNAILFNGANVPHFSYVGDSILGHKAHLGAGVILSNLKSTAGNVIVDGADTGLRKFGAIIGDNADIGCNCVLNPGSIIGRRTVLYPNILWRGIAPADAIIKLRQQCELVARQP